jgi:hypothetical protein
MTNIVLPKRREAPCFFALDEFGKNLTSERRRILDYAAVPDVEDPRLHSSRGACLPASDTSTLAA